MLESNYETLILILLEVVGPIITGKCFLHLMVHFRRLRLFEYRTLPPKTIRYPRAQYIADSCAFSHVLGNERVYSHYFWLCVVVFGGDELVCDFLACAMVPQLFQPSNILDVLLPWLEIHHVDCSEDLSFFRRWLYSWLRELDRRDFIQSRIAEVIRWRKRRR